MKKIFALIVLVAAFCSAFAAKNRMKDHITETKLGSYDEFEIGSGSLKTKSNWSGAWFSGLHRQF